MQAPAGGAVEGGVAGLAGQDQAGNIASMTYVDLVSAWKLDSKALSMVAAVALCGGLNSSSLLAGEANWPQFRGPGALGITTNKDLPENWSASENVAWKAEIAGRGWSSPIVWGDRVFLTTAVNSGASEAPK